MTIAVDVEHAPFDRLFAVRRVVVLFVVAKGNDVADIQNRINTVPGITGLTCYASFTMRTAVRGTVRFTCVVVDMKSWFAGCQLTSTGGGAYSGSRMARKGIAVLAVRTAMGIVILTKIFFVGPGRLLADVVVALFVRARSGGTNLLDRA